MVSDRGRQIFEQRKVNPAWLENQIYLFEPLLQFEQFMKMKSIPIEYTLDERRLGAAMDHVLRQIDGTIHRGEKSMGNNTAKNHLLSHLPQYMSRWGVPTAMDSGDSERNHKFEVKQQSRWTQRRQHSFLPQYGQRWHETRLVRRAVSQYRRVFGIFEEPGSGNSLLPEGTITLDGSKFKIGSDDKGRPAMGWRDTKTRSIRRSTHPQAVVDFLCHNLLMKVVDNEIKGATEAKIILEGESIIFRAHPNYRSDTNQRLHMWYDWANFHIQVGLGFQTRPGQICAIVEVGKLKLCPNGHHQIRRRPIASHEPHAVVRLFDAEPKLKFRKSMIPNSQYTYSVKWGRIQEGFFLLPLTSIVSPAIVVPNIEEDKDLSVRCPQPLGGGFFVFPSRQQLEKDFIDVIDREASGVVEGEESETSGSAEETAEADERSESSFDLETETSCKRVDYLNLFLDRLDLE